MNDTDLTMLEEAEAKSKADRSKSKLDIIDPIRLQDRPVPDRRWIVGDWIPWHSVTLFGGDGGDGKSTLAMQLATACAIGQNWLGLRTEPVKVFYLACEDTADEMHRRQEAINRHYGIDFGDLENLRWMTRVGQNNLLDRHDQFGGIEASDFAGRLLNEATQFGAQLLVLDSLHDLFGGNENSRAQVRQFVGLLREFAIELDGGVLLIYHPSVAGRASGTGEAGSTAWNNAARSRLYLRRPDDNAATNDERILSRKKANYAGAGADLAMRWRDGAFVQDAPATGVFSSIERARADRVFLACLDAIGAQGRHAAHGRGSPHYAPKVFAKMRDADGMKAHDLEAAMQRLFDAGVIEVGSVGRYANRSLITGIRRRQADDTIAQ